MPKARDIDFQFVRCICSLRILRNSIIPCFVEARTLLPNGDDSLDYNIMTLQKEQLDLMHVVPLLGCQKKGNYFSYMPATADQIRL